MARFAGLRKWWSSSPIWKKGLIVAAAVVGCIILYNRRQSLLYLLEPAPKGNAVVFIGGSKAPDRRGDIVFVHGLDGDAWTTWGDKDADFYWPRWIHEKNADLGVWSIDYDSASSRWAGHPMAIGDRSENLLDQMFLEGLGKRPIIFVCHSMGGIVVKRMIEDGATLNKMEYQTIVSQTKGVAFLATPHAGSDATDLGNLVRLYRKSRLIDDLALDNAALRKLNTWYKQNAPRRNIATLVYVEKYDIPGIGIIVSASSADPGITDVLPVGVDFDHLTICKPTGENQVCKGVAAFIERYLQPPGVPIDTSLAEFMAEYEEAKKVTSGIENLLEKYKGKRFTWDAYTRERFSQRESDPTSGPAYLITVDKATRGEGLISATFPRNDPSYNGMLPNGTKIRISGVLGENTSRGGIFIKECQLLELLDE